MNESTPTHESQMESCARIGIDPKGAAGASKIQLQLVPPILNRGVASVMATGASKYGAWNWRSTTVLATTYIGAIRRHLDAWQDGQDMDPESGVSHLAHVAANCAILLDAGSVGTLDDDRSIHPESAGWKRVSYSNDCIEPGLCSLCGLEYLDECKCPGPTQDGMEYMEIGMVLYAREFSPKNP